MCQCLCFRLDVFSMAEIRRDTCNFALLECSVTQNNVTYQISVFLPSATVPGIFKAVHFIKSCWNGNASLPTLWHALKAQQQTLCCWWGFSFYADTSLRHLNGSKVVVGRWQKNHGREWRRELQIRFELNAVALTFTWRHPSHGTLPEFSIYRYYNFSESTFVLAESIFCTRYSYGELFIHLL